MDALEIVKTKMPNLSFSDKELSIFIEEVGQSIKTYCNRDDIPPGLSFVHANMVIDLITAEERKADPDAQKEVTSIKEGDVQVNFGGTKTSASEAATQRILYNYTSQLNRYRKLRR